MSPSVPAEGTELAYVTVGRGRRVVLLHGGPGLGHAYLRPGFDRLSDRFEVIYYDQRGSGDSPVGDAEGLTMGQHVRDLEAMRRGLGIERLNLVGHSAGAILGLLYAAEHPDRAACVVASGPAPPFDPALGRELSVEMMRRSTPAAGAERDAIERSEAFAAREPSALERYFQVLYAPFFDDPETAGRVDFGFTRNTAENVLEAEKQAFASFDLDPNDLLARVTCPTLVVYGANEPVPVEFARSVADRVQDGTLMVLDQANHFAYVETPDPFFAAVVPFLDERAA